MKFNKIFLVIIGSSLLSMHAWGQAQLLKTATLCGKEVGSRELRAIYTVAELAKCDYRIVPRDTGYVVSEFQMSMIPKDKAHTYQEITITGDQVPEFNREIIQTQVKVVYFEYIKAKNSKGQQIALKPFSIKIQ